MIAGCGLGLLVSQLNNYTLSPISEERVSEAAGVNSAAGSFGLSFGLASAGAILLATLAIVATDLAHDSKVLPAAAQQQVGDALEDDAEVMSDTQLEAQLRSQPPQIQGGDPGHQRGRAAPGAAGGAARPDPGRRARHRQRVADDAPAGPEPSASAGMALG